MNTIATMQLTDLRRRRADALTSALMHVISPYLADETGHEHKDAFYAIFDEMYQSGAEVITDADRAAAGLQPRGRLGWTQDELAALEKQRLEMMTGPILMRTPDTVC